MLGEFNGAGKPKTSLTKYSVEFNDFAKPRSLHQNPYRGFSDKTVDKDAYKENEELMVIEIRELLNDRSHFVALVAAISLYSVSTMLINR